LRFFATLVLLFSALAFSSVPGTAATLAHCAADFSSCAIPENVLLQLPFLGISGDVILLEADHSTVSDVFRIFNDALDTGGGTGLGDLAFLYSSDDSTPLPAPSTYSANAVFIQENPSGITHFNGNGTDYVLAIPEPCTFALLGFGLAAIVGLTRKRPDFSRRFLVFGT
jgi:hypothetical protein